MATIISPRLPNNFKTKLLARERDLAEIATAMTEVKDQNVQSQLAFRELSTLSELCQSSAESIMSDLDLDGVLAPVPETDGSPRGDKEYIRNQMYGLLSAATLMQREYRQMKEAQAQAGRLLQSGKGSMTPTEYASHAPRGLASHIGALETHLMDGEDDQSGVQTSDPQFAGNASGDGTVSFPRPSLPSKSSAMK